jgi:CheY-like chemotaxis protein
MPHLFERFRQADSGVARQHGGLGLGLSIVSNLVRLHGGDVQAASDGLGRGASFRVRLPASRDAVAPPAVRSTTAMPSDAETSVHGIRILVVDDEADVRRAVSGLLERAGAVVLALESGASVECSLTEFRPDVLVLDIGMPGEDGFTLIERIRRLPKAAGAATPAISLTAHVRDEDRRHAIDLGFQAHLAKPVDVTALLSTIRRLVHAAGAQQSTHASEQPAGL